MRKLLTALPIGVVVCAMWLAASFGVAQAQNTTGLVVSVCGTPPNPFVAGRPGPFTVDTTGTLCSSSGGGGTVTQGPQGTNAAGWWAWIGDGTNGPVSVKPASTAASTADVSLVVQDPRLLTAVQGPIPAGTNNVGNVGFISQYPNGATPITASATGTTAATTATLAASASIKTYICGFSIRANATAAATNNSTVTGTITGTLNYTQWTAPLASGIGLTEQIFNPCIPSSAVNTAIAVISGAPGSGGVVSVAAWGYQL